MANVIVNFYPRPPRGGRPAICAPYFAFSAFLSTPSARRATTNWVTLSTQFLISIHALREEGDECPQNHRADPQNFYPRPPRGGRPNQAKYSS